MSEQSFRSPGFFDAEQDLSTPEELGPSGVPGGLVGASTKGPAFVPVTCRDFPTFEQTFGTLDVRYPAPYAANEFLKHRQALTFLRVLGCGALETSGDVSRYQTTGQARNAGFTVTGSVASTGDARHKGAVQFLVARHTLRANEAYGMPMFTENSTFAGSIANLIRGVVLLASGARLMVLDGTQSAVGAFGATTPDDVATLDSSSQFKLVLSSSNGSSFATTDGNVGVRIFTASLDPTSQNYFAKLLNTDPEKFASEQHLVYADLAVDDELATPTTVAILSGSNNTSNSSGDSTMKFRDAFGHFDTKYQTPTTTNFISQPFGSTEYDLFRVEALDDGEFANQLYKITISDLKASVDPANPYGTFTVLVRAWDDDDQTPQILEQFPACSLDPNSGDYVARKVGDRKVYFNFLSDNVNERRLVTSGKYANRSKFVRVVMSDLVDRGMIPAKSLPFGFRGLEVLKTNDATTDRPQGSTLTRLAGVMDGSTSASLLSGSVVPPVPFRFKVTKGQVATSGFVGNPGPTEIVSANFCWGVKFERNNVDALNVNVNSEKSRLVESLTRFLGIRQLDAVVTGSNADALCNNKFTLARVAFSNTVVSDLTGTIEAHMKEAAYIRNGAVDPSTYTVGDGTISARLSLATLVAQTSSVQFNRFSSFTKFTTFLHGGFDGNNILDRASRRMSDRAASFDLGGGAEATYVSPGLAANQNGTTTSNNTVFAFKTAADIMTNPFYVNVNMLATPGLREPYVTSYTAQKVRDYGMAIYLMDPVPYDDTTTRLYEDVTTRPDVTTTARQFDSRALDNSYSAAYFPDVLIDDSVNKRRVRVPASVAAMAALAYNDRVSYPWFAPAGFNRAALDFVANTTVRLTSADRAALDDVRLNPIAQFPKQGIVIFGQKTLQASRSALDRVNVRRLLLEVKRLVVDVALKIEFEQNIPETRATFRKEAGLRMGLIQAQSGLEQFKVIMDDSNNSARDADDLRLNGKIILVPTRTIEHIAVTFVIARSGVSFVD